MSYDPNVPNGYTQQFPQQPPPKKKHTTRNIGLAVLCVFIVAIVAAVIAAAATTPTTTTNSVQGSNAQPAASQPAYTQSASPQPPTCTQQADTWRDAHGSKDSADIASGLQSIAQDASGVQDGSVSYSTLEDDAIGLTAVATRAKTEMPPSCIPNLDGDYGTAMSAIQETGTYLMQAASSEQQGDYTTALESLSLGNAEIQSAETYINNSTTDITDFNNSNGS